MMFTDVKGSRAAAQLDRQTFEETGDLQEARRLQANEDFITAEVPSPVRLSLNTDLRELG